MEMVIIVRLTEGLTVNGKMVCAMKKVKHSDEKSTDEIQDATD
jgi:hypothetical protein